MAKKSRTACCATDSPCMQQLVLLFSQLPLQNNLVESGHFYGAFLSPYSRMNFYPGVGTESKIYSMADIELIAIKLWKRTKIFLLTFRKCVNRFSSVQSETRIKLTVKNKHIKPNVLLSITYNCFCYQ